MNEILSTMAPIDYAKLMIFYSTICWNGFPLRFTLKNVEKKEQRALLQFLDAFSQYKSIDRTVENERMEKQQKNIIPAEKATHRRYSIL